MTDDPTAQPKRRGRPKKVYPRLGVESDDPAATMRAIMLCDEIDANTRLRAARALAELLQQRDFDPLDVELFPKKT